MVGVCGEELLAALVAVGDATGVAPCGFPHQQVVDGIAYHEGLVSLYTKGREGFQGEVGCGFGMQVFVLAIGMAKRDIICNT